MRIEDVVLQAYHAAEGSVLDVPGFIASFTDDGVFTNKVGPVPGETFRGERLGDMVRTMASMFPDVHRELHRVTVTGDTVAVELSIQGTFQGPMPTPAGVLEPNGATIDVPTADFFYLRDGKIEVFNCYIGISVLLAQIGVAPDFAAAMGVSAAV